MTKRVNILRTGLLGYAQSCKLQNLISSEVRKKTLPDTLIVTEHNPVYTVGIRDKLYSAEEEAKLIQLGAEFHRTNRGGLITFHGPGQMVVYPIIDLRNFQPSIRWYVRQLESTIIDMCSAFGITAYTSSLTGVWVEDKKICALGIHASRYITTHGLALNCDIDLVWFSHIVPCGLVGKTVTSISEQLKENVSVNEALPQFKKAFSVLFDCSLQEFDLKETKNILQKIKS